MWILPILGYLGLFLGFSFLTLAIASGLYYLSELVEEHTVFAKKVLTRMIYGVIGALALLGVVDRFPAAWTVFSIASHVVYLQNMRRFPVVKLTDPIFIVSCILVIANHYIWFRHFSAPPSTRHSPSSSSSPYRRLSSYSYNDIYEQRHASFSEVAAFFGLCIWLVPFALFVSLSASENVLPSMGSEYATGEGSSFISAGRVPGAVGLNGSIDGMASGRGKTANAGLAKALVDNVRGWVGETGELMGFWRGDRGGRGGTHRF